MPGMALFSGSLARETRFVYLVFCLVERTVAFCQGFHLVFGWVRPRFLPGSWQPGHLPSKLPGVPGRLVFYLVNGWVLSNA